MPDGMSVRSDEHHDTQLHTIRDLMISAARRGDWLTLGEIARLTEIGEASISAQLRHLRKWRHGRHKVEKRIRASCSGPAELPSGKGSGRKNRSIAGPTIWEYRVLPSARCAKITRSAKVRAESRRLLSNRTQAERPGFVATGQTNTEAFLDMNGRSGRDGCGDVAGGIEREGREVSDAEARA